ncbi:MAG: RrF2 family transcriptional regulator [Candidatus Schekmanbacteria bacterium]|nr:RrF2 family transcriptional regulator [Candidatus Schekmanbacteria bacterium]
MKISSKGYYAVKALLDMAQQGRGISIPLSVISKRQSIPLNYLEQLFGKMRKAGIVKSIRGPRGGYILAKNPEEITIKQIIESLGISLAPVFCLETEFKQSKSCLMMEECLSRVLWEKLGLAVNSLLNSISIADLLKEAGKEKKKTKLDHDYTFNI